VRLSRRGRATLVFDQAEVLQAREQLGDLAGIGDPGRLRNLTVARAPPPPTERRYREQHLHRAIGETHVELTQRIAAVRRERLAAGRGPRGLSYGGGISEIAPKYLGAGLVAGSTSITLTGLTNGIFYKIGVASTDGTGNVVGSYDNIP